MTAAMMATASANAGISARARSVCDHSGSDPPDTVRRYNRRGARDTPQGRTQDLRLRGRCARHRRALPRHLRRHPRRRGLPAPRRDALVERWVEEIATTAASAPALVSRAGRRRSTTSNRATATCRGGFELCRSARAGVPRLPRVAHHPSFTRPGSRRVLTRRRQRLVGHVSSKYASRAIATPVRCRWSSVSSSASGP